MNTYLSKLMKRGCEFLGSEYAIMGGAMTWVSERKLVSSLSNAGAFGVIACGSMNTDLLRAEIQATRALTTKSFGVNLITIVLFDLVNLFKRLRKAREGDGTEKYASISSRANVFQNGKIVEASALRVRHNVEIVTQFIAHRFAIGKL